MAGKVRLKNVISRFNPGFEAARSQEKTSVDQRALGNKSFCENMRFSAEPALPAANPDGDGHTGFLPPARAAESGRGNTPANPVFEKGG